MNKEKCPDCEKYLTIYKTTKECEHCGLVIEPCHECGQLTDVSHYREDENETVCEDCFCEWYAENKLNQS